jgi:hypothetical protein
MLISEERKENLAEVNIIVFIVNEVYYSVGFPKTALKFGGK